MRALIAKMQSSLLSILPKKRKNIINIIYLKNNDFYFNSTNNIFFSWKSILMNIYTFTQGEKKRD